MISSLVKLCKLIDSFTENPTLKNANTILLLAGATAAGLEVCVPEVVVREMVAHYSSELKKHAGGLERPDRPLVERRPGGH